MYESVLERFPKWSGQITLLVQQDAELAEICSDYEAVADWLVAHSHDGSAPESECAENRQLLAELETEIVQVLRARERQSRPPDVCSEELEPEPPAAGSGGDFSNIKENQ